MQPAAGLAANTSPVDEPPSRLAAEFDSALTFPTTLIVFGSSGDLVKRKLLPSLYNLAAARVLPDRFNVVAVSRRAQTDDGFREYAREAIVQFSRIEPDARILDRLLGQMRHVSLEFDDLDGYQRLLACVEGLEVDDDERSSRCIYLSTPPEFFSVIARGLRRAGIAAPELPDSRVVLEKPFGRDLESARVLAREMADCFDEAQVFRVDHYVAKETVQNILALRFANAMFEPIWNRAHIDHVQITAAEDLGVGTRAGYYDQTGAVRDIVQNHMLQLLALVCMDAPPSLAPDDLRDAKVDVFRAVTRTPEAIRAGTVRAQYQAGAIHHRPVRGYLEESGVAPESNTETYAAVRLEIDNDRWAGVPIFLRAGKRLHRKLTEVAVQFKPLPHLRPESLGFVGAAPNQLVLSIEPNEGVSLRLGAKAAGAHTRIRPMEMAFRYGPSFAEESPSAYDRLLLDAMVGTATLFTRSDEVTEQWSIVDPILHSWRDGDLPMETYEAGSQGPAQAAALLGPGREWRRID